MECKMDVQEGPIVPKDIDIFQMKVSFIISSFYSQSTTCISCPLLKILRGWAFTFDRFFYMHAAWAEALCHCCCSAENGKIYLTLFKVERCASLKYILFLLV